jgi:hypothetical protein
VKDEDGCTWCGADDCTCDGDLYVDLNLIGHAREFTQWVSRRDRQLLHDGQQLTIWGFGGSPMRAVIVHVRADEPDVTFRLLE